MKRYNLRNWLLATCKVDGIIKFGPGGIFYFWPWKSLPQGYHGENHIIIPTQDLRADLGIQKLTNKAIRTRAADILQEATR